MRDGLLWFRDDPNRTLEKDIEWATKRFQSKFRLTPDVIHVAESEVALYDKVVGFEIVPVRNVLERYFYLLYKGVKNEPA